MSQFKEGGVFNSLSYPSIDMAHYRYYVAWWAPGQWVAPWLLTLILGTANIQLLQSIIISITVLSSVIGYWSLFVRWKFDIVVIIVSLFSIISCQAFYSNSLMYNGGTTLMLGFFPWFLLLCLKLNEISGFRSWLGLILLALAACFLKNSFVILFLVFCFYAVVSKLKFDLTKLVKYGSIFSLVFAFLYLFHLSKGGTPGSSIDALGFGDQGKSLWRDLFTSIGSPFSIMFRYGLMDGSIVGPEWFKIKLGEQMSWIPVLGTMILSYFLYKSFNLYNREYSKVLLFFVFPSLLIFIPLYLVDLSISYEQRHFAPMVFLLFPSILAIVFSTRLKYVFIVALLILSGYDLSFYFVQQQKLISDNSVWNGWRLPVEEVEILKRTSDWDVKDKNGLVLIEDEWLYNVSVRLSDKYVLSNYDKRWKIESGMELDNPDWLGNSNVISLYPRVLTISKIEKQSIDELLVNYEFTVVLETEHYILKEWHPATL